MKRTLLGSFTFLAEKPKPTFVVVLGALGDRWSRRRSVAWLGGALSAADCLAL
ncbi:hypothetical protein [Streptomyces sp. IMTB 2501]|uniref:hypothetical protein n=1 Tax=Streptomyces sp. IMTB 2501 TaxID=1776340 RepID=UPI0015C146CD|nr:hypothetical protein [Streptomyces sp. IMTB 2501]